MTRMVGCTTALALAMGVALTQLPTGAYGQDQPIYGSQMMTEQERAEYRMRMRNATTDEEREQIREEHHAEMQERARERGVELPDEPPGMGMGGQRMAPRQGDMPPGRGMGSGSGMRQGGGMGGGRGG